MSHRRPALIVSKPNSSDTLSPCRFRQLHADCLCVLGLQLVMTSESDFLWLVFCMCLEALLLPGKRAPCREASSAAMPTGSIFLPFFGLADMGLCPDLLGMDSACVFILVIFVPTVDVELVRLATLALLHGLCKYVISFLRIIIPMSCRLD